MMGEDRRPLVGGSAGWRGHPKAHRKNMRSAKCIGIFLVLSLATAQVGVAFADDSSSRDDASTSITLTLRAGSYSIDPDAQGSDVIRMEDFSVDTLPGNPTLPHKTYNIALPPDVILSTLELSVISSDDRVLEGSYDINPGPPILPNADNEHAASNGDSEAPPDERNIDIYGRDAFFPESCVELLPYSQMRKWNYARVAFSPLQYNPVSKDLILIESVTIELSYQCSSARADVALNDTAMDDVAAQIFQNYDAAKGMYAADSRVAAQGPTYDYVIVTTNAIQANSTKLAEFVAYKELIGYGVRVITEDEFGSVTGQSPNHRAEKIRQWLKDNYLSMGVEYVLLVGDPSPYESGEGDIPMKMCWPRLGAVQYPDYDEAPTDYFYADLTGNWNPDDDQYYGEWEDYTSPGGVDLAPEVYVGRIPVYGAGYAALDSILQKIIDYESSTDIAWRQSALLPMSFSDSITDGAYLAEEMKDDYLDAASFNTWTMYQQGSMCSAANSGFSSDEELTAGAVVRNRWAANDYGIVCWWGHGNTQIVAAGYSGCGSAVFFQSSDCSSLDDDHPSFTYQCSCLNGYPEDANNLQYSILRQGGIGTVSATRVSWYWPTEKDFVNSPTNAGIGYEYVRRLAGGESCGEALYATTQATPVSGDWWLMNVYDFNLYGDPTTGLTTSHVTAMPPTVTTGAVSAVEESTATGNGNITSTGGEDCSARGVCWSTSPSPDIDDNNSEESGLFGTGAFDVPMTGLSQGTTYYVRAYARNGAGVGYGGELSFTTLPDGPGSLDATTDPSVPFYRINLEWIAGEGATHTYIVANTTDYPQDRGDGELVYDGTETSCVHSGLTPNITYYYRAWSWLEDAGGADVWSTDSLTATATTDVEPAPVDFSITLQPGWNMVSVPILMANMSTAVVFDGAEAVYAWDPASKSYTTPQQVTTERAYWVAVTSVTPLPWHGVPVKAWGLPVLAGWNTVGSIYYDDPAPLVNVTADAEPDPLRRNAIYTWDPVAKSYIPCTTIEPGKGYWMATAVDCTLTVEYGG